MENQKPKKQFRLFDAVLMSVVVILTVESIAPAAAIGPSQFFWWIFLLIFFFLPYGLVSSELGTAYTGEGGIYDWVKLAFGDRWGGRLAYLYWINYPLWMASLAVLFTQIVNQTFQIHMNTWLTMLIQLIFIWVVTFVGNKPISESKWLTNISAIFKIIIIVSMSALGIYVAVTKGVANNYSPSNLLPKANLSSLSNLSVIIFNFLGFEVVATMADNMDDPKRQIPKATIYGGILIAVFYLLAAFAVGVAIPTSKLSASSGLLDTFLVLMGKMNWFIVLVGIMFMFILVAEMMSWALGINYVADYAAKNHDLPTVFGKEDKNGMPIGAGLVNGTIASILCIASPFIPNQDIFWSFFSLNVVTLILSYALMFPAFWKLRKIDPDHERPFKVPGGKVMINLFTWVPEVLIILSVLLTILPTGKSDVHSKMPILIGTIIALVVGEVMVRIAQRGKVSSKNQK